MKLATLLLLTAMAAPQAPRIRIVAMGDSTTAGTPAFKSPREAPPAGTGDETSQYAYWLMKAHPEWEVVNQGINAQRSDVIAGRFDEDVIAKKPAVVVIIAGVNDVYQGRPAQHVKDQLAAMYRRAHAAGIASSPARSSRTTPPRTIKTRACATSTTGSAPRAAPTPACSSSTPVPPWRPQENPTSSPAPQTACIPTLPVTARWPTPSRRRSLRACAQNQVDKRPHGQHARH